MHDWNRYLGLKQMLLGLLLGGLCSQPASAATLPAKSKTGADFNREIRPIFSENCYTCHGPDGEKRKAGLRLDRQDGALAELKSGDRAIVPGDLTRSALISRITTTNEDDRMPPLKTGKNLTAAQISALTRWIAQGAEWQKHWSFIPPERPEFPRIANKRWPQNPIDNFILARLERERLTPSPEADKATLIRRVTFDLVRSNPQFCGYNITGMLDHVNLSKAIEQLPDGYKEIFILHDVEGYEHHEIAEILGCSAGNSKSQLYKARLRLRESLQEALRSDAREKRISHSTNCLFRNIKTLDSCPLKPESNGAGNEERRKARNRSLGVWTRCVEHVDSGCSNTPGPRSVRCVLRVRKCLTQAG